MGEPGSGGAQEWGSPGVGEPGSGGAREGGSQGVGEPGSGGAWERGSPGAEEPGSGGAQAMSVQVTQFICLATVYNLVVINKLTGNVFVITCST